MSASLAVVEINLECITSFNVDFLKPGFAPGHAPNRGFMPIRAAAMFLACQRLEP